MISLKHIDLSFEDKRIFNDLCFDVKTGEKVWLSAPSGFGKTSLFNIILGFLKPDSGEVLINGITLGKSTVQEVRRRVCYIGQDAGLPQGKVKDVMDEVAEFTVNRDKDFSKERITSLLSKFSLPESVMDKDVESLSGGERKRLAFVLCILMDRDIWLLDEITAGLDEIRKTEVMRYIATCDKTVIVVSHDAAWSEYEQIIRVNWTGKEDDYGFGRY